MINPQPPSTKLAADPSTVEANSSFLRSARDVEPALRAFQMWPEATGLLPWATTFDSVTICWDRATTSPDDWQCVLVPREGDNYERHNLGAVELLLEWSGGRLESRFLPVVEVPSFDSPATRRGLAEGRFERGAVSVSRFLEVTRASLSLAAPIRRVARPDPNFPHGEPLTAQQEFLGPRPDWHIVVTAGENKVNVGAYGRVEIGCPDDDLESARDALQRLAAELNVPVELETLPSTTWPQDD